MLRKTILLFAFAWLTAGAFAQVLTSKKGEAYLPQAGDWAISIDGRSFLDYAGNFIGGDGSNEAPRFDFLSNNQTIIGKYFVDSLSAYRFGVLIGYSNNSNTSLVSSIPATTPITYVEDVTKITSTNIGLTFGKEWRKGKTRLQGFYGAETGVAYHADNLEWTYGNVLSNNNPGSRFSEQKPRSMFLLGVRGFIGAEYFILPKIAIGGEFGWGLAFTMRGESTTKLESWNGTSVVTQENKVGGSSSFSASSENLSSIFGSPGTIRLTLHF